MKKRAKKGYFSVSVFILLFLAQFILISGCQSPRHSIPFVIIREDVFRFGPADLPLNDADKKTIFSFLQKGGNWGSLDLVDFDAPKHYSGLLDLLSDVNFLHSQHFRKKDKIDEISTTLEKWFHNPIIYQLIDATQKQPPIHNPMSMSDGKYWWVFYMQKDTSGNDGLRVNRLMITASLSKTMKHYDNIKEDALRSPSRNMQNPLPLEIRSTQKNRDISDPNGFHNTFLRQLLQVANVQLISRLRDSRIGFPYADDVRIFIPDLHLLGNDRAKTFKYGTNYVPLLTQLAQELIEFKRSISKEGAQLTVYQLGDLFDVWRETPVYLSKNKFAEGTSTLVQKIAEDHAVFFERLFGSELNTQYVLGNHDFDLHYLENFIGAELRYYFPFYSGTTPCIVALHGDLFDKKERSLGEGLKHLAVSYLGPLIKNKVYDLSPIRELMIKDHGNNKYRDYIRYSTPPILGPVYRHENEYLLSEDALDEDYHNVIEVGDSNRREGEMAFFPQAKEFAAMINNETGWDIRMVVTGHSHHARIIVDERTPQEGGFKGGFFTLVDCGAWIEEVNFGGQVVPSAQIAIIYNNDIRIYQLSPKK